MTTSALSAAAFAGARERGDPGIARWGMTLFLINEGTLFATLVASYFYLAVADPAWPPRGIEPPELATPLVMTILLLSSSAVLVWSERRLASQRRASYRAGVAVTLLLGIAFLALQGTEYAATLTRVHPTESAYGSLFFTITGLHGIHVAFGLLFLSWALLREIRGTVPPSRPTAIRHASLYWHFVDGVWLVIVTSLYLSPRWW